MKLVANIASILFHPLLMVTYGIILALSFTYLAVYPNPMKLMIAGATFLCTGVMPGFLIILFVKNETSGDLELTDRKSRFVPYLIFFVSIVACFYMMFKLMMPLWVLVFLAASAGSLLLGMTINFFWKISAHMMGIGGLSGAIMGICRLHQLNPYGAFMLLFIIAGLVGTSRILLGRHTPGQVYAGFLLGFACTFLASLLSYIYLFI